MSRKKSVSEIRELIAELQEQLADAASLEPTQVTVTFTIEPNIDDGTECYGVVTDVECDDHPNLAAALAGEFDDVLSRDVMVAIYGEDEVEAAEAVNQ